MHVYICIIDLFLEKSVVPVRMKFEVSVLTILALSLQDSLVVQQYDRTVGCRVQVLLFPGRVQITLRLQQP